MKKKTHFFISCIALTTFALSGCSGVRDKLGLEREAPDEFAVITRAPLEMPDSLALPPPRAGAPRPQEKGTIVKAQEAVFGGEQTTQSTASSSTAEQALLKKTNTGNVNPNIRRVVDEETKELEDRNKAVAKKLLNIAVQEEDASATVVDAKKEHERIQKNIEDGKSVTEGETPYIEE